MKHSWFGCTLVSLFFLTLAMEVYAVLTHEYTLSDFILSNVRMKWRVAILAWLVFHFIFEYPSYK